MKTQELLWFHIDAAFGEIQEQCLLGRAAELVAQQRRFEEQTAQALASGRTLPPPAPDKGAEGGRYARASEIAKDTAFREAHQEGADLVVLREHLRRILTELRGKLSEMLSDHEVYYVLFPLVVYCDELVATATRGAVARWERMQSEFYEIENGGELFYQILEERMKQEETHPLVLEMFYFCLLDGFTGMYLAGSKKIEEYKSLVAARIPRPAIRFPELPPERARPELVAFPWKYYAISAGVVFAVYVMFSWSAGS